MSENEDTTGARLKAVRGTASAKDFAAELGVARSTLIRYESNERPPDADFLRTLYTTRGVNPTWVVTGIGRVFSQEAAPTGAGDQLLAEVGGGYSVDGLRQRIHAARVQAKAVMEVNGLSDAWYFEEALVALGQIEGVTLDHLQFLSRAVCQLLAERAAPSADEAHVEPQ